MQPKLGVDYSIKYFIMPVVMVTIRPVVHNSQVCIVKSYSILW